MYCQNRIVHIVQEGDSLYKISRQYGTSVDELIMGNPGVNPYNLQIGMRLTVCPGEEYEMSMRPGQGNRPGGQGQNNPGTTGGNMQNGQPEGVAELMSEMQRAWMNQIFWTRMYLMAVNADTPDQQSVGERTEQTADEITDVFARAFPVSVTRQLRNLLMNQVELTSDVIRSLKSGMMDGYEDLIKSWYNNANLIAELLSSQNPYFGERETRNLLLNHLDLLREQIEQQINGDYAQSIDTFRELEKQTQEMADYFARGLLAR